MRFGLQLARCYQKIKRLKDCRGVVENIIRNEKEKQEKRLAEERQNEKSPPESADKQKALEKTVFLSQLDLLQGTLLLAEGNHYDAITFLLNAEKANPRLPLLHQHIGQTYLRMKRWDDAERAYLKAIEIDPDSAAAYHGLAISHLRRREYSHAAAYALRAVGIIHHMPLAHYHLGVALLRLGQTDRAIQTLKMALKQNPAIAPAHRWLAFIYRNQGNTAEAGKHQNQVMQLRQKRAQNRL
jgi:tetratricopeptide (TPR) repeat protein